MALNVADRLLTIVVTATLTSAGWVVAGGLWPRSFSTAEEAAAPAAPQVETEASMPPAAVAAGRLTIPVAGIRPEELTDTFGDDRGGGTRAHEALDIMAPAGTPVVAAGAGTVEKLFVSDDGGNTIYVRSPDRRTIHYYAHLQSYAPGLREGQQVKAGDPLGAVGSTGNADPAAPHLHFAVMSTTPAANWYDPATPINPFPLMAAR